MTEQNRQSPRLAEAGEKRVEARLDREARALRENLSKRKAQLRARTAAADRAVPGAGKTDRPADP